MKKIFTLLCGLLLMTSATMHADQFTLNGIKYDTSPSYAGLTYHYLVKVVGVTTSGATLTVGGNTTVSYNNRNYTVYEVDRYALRNNSNLKTLKVVGSFDFEPGTFLGCNNLQTVDMSAVNDELYFEIADSLFYGCSQITSLKLPTACWEIEKYAFKGCSGLTSLTVNYAHFIEPTAFTGCSHVTTITWNNPETMGDPSGSATSISGAATTQAPFYAIRNQIKTAYINTNANALVCSNMSNLEKAYIDSNVKSIYVKAFYNCPKLSKVYLNNNSSSVLIGLKHIDSFGENCFYNCTSLTGDLVVEGEEYLSFYENAFYKTGITSLTINNSPYTYIGKNAFQNCTALKSITLNTGINEIEKSAFSGCTAVTKLTWTSSDSFFNKATFSWGNGGPVTKLTNLEELVINRKGRIDKFEFDGLQKLKKLTIGSNVTWVDDYAFNNCTNIQNVSWSPSAMQAYTSQDATPFYSSQGKITTFAFGSNITYIPPYLLCGQTQLSVVSIPSGVISIGHHAFFNVPLTSLTLPESLKSIGLK